MRPAFLIGGLCGAGGVALSAYAAHAGGEHIGTAAQMMLFHAPAFLALGLFPAGWLRGLAIALLAAGLMLFAGDLLARAFTGTRLFPMAAPTGGLMMIGGWQAVTAAGVFARRG